MADTLKPEQAQERLAHALVSRGLVTQDEASQCRSNGGPEALLKRLVDAGFLSSNQAKRAAGELPSLLGQQILQKLNAASVLITRGEKGMSLFERKKPPVHIPTFAREVYDVTGAGDTVISTLTLALAAGASLRVAAEMANRAAGIVVGKLGTAAVSRTELETALRNGHD